MTRKLLIGLAVLGITLATLGVVARRVAAPADGGHETTERIDSETVTIDVET
ncbi:hypothetical protein SAMN04487950_4131 [Halogranum rubrum]|uniref:Uncharacterized protein n=2 Tax=Halogranum rubrum TaxID=553466 RepID=A0A1I4IJA1_9EURY|nr:MULTISPECIES: hypothetical protein [Halogranum]EJN57215.1 hypothetical protein HSB1_46010 [Halogranum salarium B-1]SFL53856.1 hypothetical protein SAMN04487950_4131 [Halogranum rubrum]